MIGGIAVDHHMRGSSCENENIEVSHFPTLNQGSSRGYKSWYHRHWEDAIVYYIINILKVKCKNLAGGERIR